MKDILAIYESIAGQEIGAEQVNRDSRPEFTAGQPLHFCHIKNKDAPIVIVLSIAPATTSLTRPRTDQGGRDEHYQLYLIRIRHMSTANGRQFQNV